MDKIEKIRQEIKRHRQAIRVLNEHTAPEQTSKTCAIFQYSDTILSELLSFLDTLSEEPDKSLEEAAEEKYPIYWKNYPKDGVVRSESAYDTNKQCRDAFIVGAEWQKKRFEAEYELDWLTDLKKDLYELGRKDEREQMMKEAVEGEVIKTDKHTSVRYKSFYGTDRYFYGIADKQFKPGDKVRIIVLKAEEENK